MPYEFIAELEEVIAKRHADPQDNSYTSSLFSSGIKHIGRKVGEEAVELIMEIHADDNQDFLDEAADLLYHTLVLLRARGYSLSDVEEILQARHKK